MTLKSSLQQTRSAAATERSWKIEKETFNSLSKKKNQSEILCHFSTFSPRFSVLYIVNLFFNKLCIGLNIGTTTCHSQRINTTQNKFTTQIYLRLKGTFFETYIYTLVFG